MLVETNKILETDAAKNFLNVFKNADEAGREDIIGSTREEYLKKVAEINKQILDTNKAINALTNNINAINTTIEGLKRILEESEAKKEAREKEIENGTSTSGAPTSYANGGVVDSGLLKDTGMLSDKVKVHGTPTNPEVILNGRQQANLLYKLAQQKPSVNNNSSNVSSSSVYVAHLTIQADSQDTLSGLLLQAKQLALVGG